MKLQGKKCILFCHYGNSPYLQYTLKQAKFTNPEYRIILLGDQENIQTAKNANVEHFYFRDFDNSAEILKFEEVFKHVAGIKHKKEFWTKFVFKRWFYIHNFIRNNNINAFWHFDSDNMILTNLEDQEYKFKNFDCTEQCDGICMNGYIASFEVVDGYVNKINDLFEDEEYLNEQKIDFLENPDFAFTEMRAYKAYKEQEKIKSIRLNKIINKESFDDCICQDHGYDVYIVPLGGRYLKKVYIDSEGNFYCYHIASSTFVKMNSLNLSWVPTNIFKLVFKEFKKKYRKVGTAQIKEYELMDVFQTKSLRSRVLRLTPQIFKKIVKSIIKKRNLF